MKYVISWKPRPGGSGTDNEVSTSRFSNLLKSWTPAKGTTIHQYVVRIDGEGGFAVIESDDPVGIAKTIFGFAPFFEYTAYPVVDGEEGVRAASEAEEFRLSVS